MKNKNNKNIVYVYRGSNYVERVKNTVPYKSVTKEGSNVTYVYLRRRSVSFTILMMLVSILCVFINVFMIPRVKSVVYYSNPVYYWDNTLYVNLQCSSDANIPVCYKILNTEGVLRPGDSLISIPMNEYKDNIEIGLKYLDIKYIPYIYHDISVYKVEE